MMIMKWVSLIDTILFLVAHIDHEDGASWHLSFHSLDVVLDIFSKDDLSEAWLFFIVLILAIYLGHFMSLHHVHLEWPLTVCQNVLYCIRFWLLYFYFHFLSFLDRCSGLGVIFTSIWFDLNLGNRWFYAFSLI